MSSLSSTERIFSRKRRSLCDDWWVNWGRASMRITPLIRSYRNGLWWLIACIIVRPPIPWPIRNKFFIFLFAMYSTRSNDISSNVQVGLLSDSPWFLESRTNEFPIFRRCSFFAIVLQLFEESNISCIHTILFFFFSPSTLSIFISCSLIVLALFTVQNLYNYLSFIILFLLISC